MKSVLLFFNSCFCLVALVVYGCTSSTERKDIPIEDIQLNKSVELTRTDSQILKLSSREDIHEFLSAHTSLKQAFFVPMSGMPDSEVVNRIYRTITDSAYRKFYLGLQQQFEDMQAEKEKLENAFKHIKYYYSDFLVPDVQVVPTGLGYFSTNGAALSVSDSLIIIGLDFYGGADASFVPNVPNYLLRKYSRPALVPSIISLLAEKYIRKNAEDKTLLNDMIFQAKKLEFTKQIMPDTPDSLIIGYSQDQLEDTEKNKDVVWAHFIKEKLLYETNHFKKFKYIEDRPYTAEIGTKCPGGIGKWVGWKIIQKYLQENPAVTLPQLLSNPNAQDIFIKSNYKGE